MDHHLATLLAAILAAVLCRRIGAFKRKVFVGLLQIFAAVALPQNTVFLLDLKGVREDLVTGDDILISGIALDIANSFLIFLIFFFCKKKIK